MSWENEIRSRIADVEIQSKLILAVEDFLTKDQHLLEARVHERTSGARLGMYLQNRFPIYDVDCEYDKNDHDPKVVGLPDKKNILALETTKDRSVYPDIIVHKRGTNQNLMVFEIKKDSNPEDEAWDKLKLKKYKKCLGYKISVYIRFEVGRNSNGISKIEIDST